MTEREAVELVLRFIEANPDHDRWDVAAIEADRELVMAIDIVMVELIQPYQKMLAMLRKLDDRDAR
jgi:hypothetical protein